MGYVTSLFARKVIAAAGDAVDGAAFLREAGVDPDGAWDPKAMLLDTIYYDLLEREPPRVCRRPVSLSHAAMAALPLWA
jgi:hypothetical protein